MINVQIEIKFRFVFDLGTFKRQVGIRYDGALQAGVVPWTEVPAGAKKVLDERGAKITVWVG
jgi:hypothetical protein